MARAPEVRNPEITGTLAVGAAVSFAFPAFPGAERVPDDVEQNEVSAKAASVGSEIFWRLMAGVIFISVVWILWVLWQITPKATFNPIVFQINQARQSSSGSIRGTSPAEASQSGAEAPASRQGAPVSSGLVSGAPLENLKIETELKTAPAAPPR